MFVSAVSSTYISPVQEFPKVSSIVSRTTPLYNSPHTNTTSLISTSLIKLPLYQFLDRVSSFNRVSFFDRASPLGHALSLDHALPLNRVFFLDRVFSLDRISSLDPVSFLDRVSSLDNAFSFNCYSFFH